MNTVVIACVLHEDLVPQEKMIEGGTVTIRCAHGDTILYPLAEVDMEIGRRRITVEAAASDKSPMFVLLRTERDGGCC